ncbi:hypothetical protein AB5J62_22100 [Amycolatopsis sp. cg5]|uniref:hypothetical protein n=1 Tax=Amycolatopsis sp. cg5 TaxID=3238802 RepID=UPI0035246138
MNGPVHAREQAPAPPISDAVAVPGRPAAEPRYEWVDETGKKKQGTAAELADQRKQAEGRVGRGLRKAKDHAETNRSTHEWFMKEVHGTAESLGDVFRRPGSLVGIAVDIRSGVVPPPIGMWSHAIRAAKDGERALAEGNLREAARLLAKADRDYRDSVREWNAYMDAIQKGGQKLVGELEVVRDVSFAIAITAAVILAAPVVAGGVAWAGATGTLATAGTALGTGAVGAAAGAGLRSGASAAGQKIVHGKVSGKEVASEAKRGAREGFVTGLTAGAGHGLGAASGQGASFGQQVVRRAAVEGSANAVGQATDAALQGKSTGEVLEAGGAGFATGVVTAPLGTAGAKLASGGRPALGKAVGVGGAAVLAGGGTLAAGGTWQDATTNASIAAGTAAALGAAKQPARRVRVATHEKVRVATEEPHVQTESAALHEETAPKRAARARAPEPVTEHPPAPQSAPQQAPQAAPPAPIDRVAAQENVVDAKRNQLFAAGTRARSASAAVSRKQRDLTAAGRRLSEAETRHQEARTQAEAAEAAVETAKPGAKRPAISARKDAKAELRKAASDLTAAQEAHTKADEGLQAAKTRLATSKARFKARAAELKTSKEHLENVKKWVTEPGEAPRQRRGEPFSEKNRRPNLSDFKDLPAHPVERADAPHDPNARVRVFKNEVRKDLRAEHAALYAELQANPDKAKELGHVYERMIGEDLTRGGNAPRMRSDAGDKLRISDHGVHEFTVEGEISDGKLDQLWRDLLTPTPGARVARDTALLTVPKLTPDSGNRLARMAAAYENLTGRRPLIVVRETAP